MVDQKEEIALRFTIFDQLKENTNRTLLQKKSTKKAAATYIGDQKIRKTGSITKNLLSFKKLRSQKNYTSK